MNLIGVGSNSLEAGPLNAVRGELFEILSALKANDNASFDAKTTAARVGQELDAIVAEGFAPDFTVFARQAPAVIEFGWRQPVRFCDLLDILGRAAFERHFERACKDLTKNGLSFTEIATRRAALLEKQRALEIREERACMALEKNRFVVIRRGLADAARILQIWNEEQQT